MLREYIYLDVDRVASLSSQLGLRTQKSAELPAEPATVTEQIASEQMAAELEVALVGKGGVPRIDAQFDFNRWTADAFTDGQLVQASGAVRLLDYAWLAQALGGLPAVLRKMHKLEMEALRNSDEGRRMSKSQLQQRGQENLNAIAQVEGLKADELGDVVGNLYGDVVRVKVRPSPQDHPRAVFVGSADVRHFYDTSAALAQKYGVEVNAGWTVFAQVNVPNAAGQPLPVPVGNQMEDSFEQMALLMNNAFRFASAPQFPTVSITPIAIYRAVGATLNAD